MSKNAFLVCCVWIALPILAENRVLTSTGAWTVLTPPGAFGYANSVAINAKGTVVGNYFDSNGRSYGFLYEDGLYTMLGFPGAVGTFPQAINDKGEVAGIYRDAASNAYGFRYSNGVFSSIDPPHGHEVLVKAINNKGEIAGSFVADDGSVVGFVFHDDSYTVLQPFRYVEVSDLNNRGEVVVLGGVADAFVYRNGTYTTITPPGANQVSSPRINDKGDVTARYQTLAGSFVYIYSKGVFMTLNLPGWAFGVPPPVINNKSEVAGWYFDSENHIHAFLYKDGIYQSLDPPAGWAGFQPAGINDKGQVVGSALLFTPGK